jgi:HSP20 family molecular chaperone IbpA
MDNSIPIEVHHRGHAMTVVARLPGMRFEDVHVALTRDRLTIDADFLGGSRHLALAFPYPVDDRRASLRFCDGVLSMHLPKLPA